MTFYFSLIAPLLGIFLNPIVAISILLMAIFFRSYTSSISQITFGAPTFIATLCWIFENRNTNTARIMRIVLNVILPITCIIIFCSHPVGRGAIFYSFYWLIPPALFFMKHNNKWAIMFNSSFRITFVTHAIGSIMWLFFVPSTSIYWINLIPVVIFERFRLAGITFAMVAVIKSVEKLKKINFFKIN